MAFPTLTADELAQMKKEQAKAIAAAETFTNQIAAGQARALELAKVDSAFKKFYDYYGLDIIEKYDAEKRALNGTYILNPVTEADIQNVGNIQGGRLQPALPATDIVRIPEFDGGGTAVDPLNETQFIADQTILEDVLVNGYGGIAPDPTVVTTTAITTASTTLTLEDPAATFSIAPNTVLIVSDGIDLAVIRILTFVLQVAPAPPPHIANCTIEVLVPPSGSIAPGESLIAFNGFNNTERTTKTASDAQLQPLMNYLVAELQSKINGRITNLNSQLAAISTNLDPDGTANLLQATTDANASKSFLTNYIISTNISNSGLGGLSVERSTRSSQITTRVGQIDSAYTGQTLNYYNERYNAANNRGNTSRGSLRLQKAAEQVSLTAVAFAQTLTDQANAIGSILP